MENRFRAIIASNREPKERSLRLADDTRLARAAAEEFFLMGMPRVNVLLEGRIEALRLVIRTLLGHVAKPVWMWSPGAELVLPPIEWPGTLVLDEVAGLTLQEQIQVLQWSAGPLRNTQVISTTSEPLLPRVRAGSFIDILYYRLNTVYLDIAGLDDAA